MTRSSSPRIRLRAWPAALLGLALCCAPAAHAEKADREKNIEFQGDTGGGNAETKTGELVGHVIITQGTMTIQADRVTFKQNADNSLSATAYGNPVRFREKRDGADDYYEGYAQRIVYDGEKRFVELFDNALLKKSGNEIRSNYISYSAATENFSAEGRPDVEAGGRRRRAAGRAGARNVPAQERGEAGQTRRQGQERSRTGQGQGRRGEGQGCGGQDRRAFDAQAFRRLGASEMSKLSAEQLRKRYKARTVVHDVSLDVASGEVVGLLGPNGAGKTTCFYMIVGLIAADGGRIELDGENLSRLPIHRRARRGLSYLPQEASIFRKLTVAENVRAILELQDLDADTLSNRLDALLEDLSISHLADAPAISLSGGERRRCEIARALATRPRFILLDEPFAGVDPIAVLDIQKIIGFLKERGIGVLITDHNVRETLGICDRAYIINEGRVLASGAPGEIVYNEDVRKVYLGEHFRL